MGARRTEINPQILPRRANRRSRYRAVGSAAFGHALKGMVDENGMIEMPGQISIFSYVNVHD